MSDIELTFIIITLVLLFATIYFQLREIANQIRLLNDLKGKTKELEELREKLERRLYER